MGAPKMSHSETLMSTGVAGLDDVLGGGLTPNRLYLLEGTPGAGKTTIALQFLMEGARRGESVLYVTLSETETELQGVARSHGWNLSSLHMREMLPTQETLQPEEQYTMFHPSEVELSETTLRILKDVEQLAPSRIVFDSLSELRLLSGNSLRYRRQILALKQFFSGRQCTVMLLDDMTASEHDLQVQSIAHAVMRLEQLHSDYGAARRRMVVVKYRGKDFRGGYPPGTGKSTVAVQFALAAARRGERAALFIFDESITTLCTRCASMNMDLRPYIESGLINIKQVDPGELSPGELVHSIRVAVLEQQAQVIVIDSLNGYLNAMPDERFLIVQLHELLTFLGQAGVATLLVGAQHGLIGSHMHAPVDASYLADAVVLLRYFEHAGEVRQAISVMKKRGGAHERSIRAFSMDRDGLHVGGPLRELRGILTGVPTPIDNPYPASSA